MINQILTATYLKNIYPTRITLQEKKEWKYPQHNICWNLESRRKDQDRREDIRGAGNSITVHVPFNLITLANLASFQPPVTTALPLTNNIVDDPAGAFWFDLLHYKSVLLGRASNRTGKASRRLTKMNKKETKDSRRMKETAQRGGWKIVYYWYFTKARFLNNKILILKWSWCKEK